MLDAIQHTGPGDVWLRSTVTHERADGTASLDPAWAQSKSGTRLAQVGDGWVYRKGMHGLDALQVVALEERITTSEPRATIRAARCSGRRSTPFANAGRTSPSTRRPALGGMLEQLIELGAIEFRSEPLDAIVERRLKAVWTTRICPNCGADTLQALDGSARIWCGRCDWKTTYTRGTLFYDSELAPGEFLIAFVLYADTLLSTVQIAGLLEPTYKTLFEVIKDMEAAFDRSFLTVWNRVEHTIAGPTQVDEIQQVCSGFKGQDPPRTDCPAADRLRTDGHGGRVNRVMS